MRFNRFDDRAVPLNQGARIEMNQIRFVCNDSDKKGIHIKSTLDGTYKLDGRTDESISFRDDDLVAIKNCLEHPCQILLESIRLPHGRFALLSPSRQATFKLLDKEQSTIHSEKELVLGPGETCMVRSSMWQSEGGEGRRFPV